jgi:hypothetical protein
MPRYTGTVDTVTNHNREESETDRMWRQIDPVLYDAMN